MNFKEYNQVIEEISQELKKLTDEQIERVMESFPPAGNTMQSSIKKVARFQKGSAEKAREQKAGRTMSTMGASKARKLGADKSANQLLGRFGGDKNKATSEIRKKVQAELDAVKNAKIDQNFKK